MPKKVKLNINGLKVASFVTSLNTEEKEKVKGGAWTWEMACRTDLSCDARVCPSAEPMTCTVDPSLC